MLTLPSTIRFLPDLSTIDNLTITQEMDSIMRQTVYYLNIQFDDSSSVKYSYNFFIDAQKDLQCLRTEIEKAEQTLTA
jgi:hypothetical protein